MGALRGSFIDLGSQYFETLWVPALHSEENELLFEASHSAHNGLKSYIRLSRAFSRIAANLFQNPADAFRHGCPRVRVVDKHGRATTENRQLWGFLWGPLIPDSEVEPQILT